MSERRIVNRFEELLAQKERRDGQRYSRQAISDITGISVTSVQNWASNTTTRFDAKQILVFSDFLECEPGDLFAIEEVQETNSPFVIKRIRDAIPT